MPHPSFEVRKFLVLRDSKCSVLVQCSGGARAGGGGGHPSTRHPAQHKLICTSTIGGTSAVSLVTRFFKAEHRLTYVSR